MRRAAVALFALLALLALGVSRAAAQRYTIVVESLGAPQRSLIEFRPCIPVEGSDCGAWLSPAGDRRGEAAEAPAAAQSGTTPDGRFAVAIRNGVVAVMPLAGKDSGHWRPAAGVHGRATAIALSGDSQFAFVLTAGRSGAPAEVCMIYLDWRSVFARQALSSPATGLSVIR